ncbi:hypothetical protein GCM10009613_35740 [Pseudonocardia kongjuensis]|uniref:Uncharacterized protein n=1 Tax=Pseudonocardia kongjuensis TaxID=102227 RepID=A0ABN1XZ76_9PSEU
MFRADPGSNGAAAVSSRAHRRRERPGPVGPTPDPIRTLVPVTGPSYARNVSGAAGRPAPTPGHRRVRPVPRPVAAGGPAGPFVAARDGSGGGRAGRGQP